MNIGENLKRLRVQRNMTQADIAKAVNASQSMIAQVERGTKTLTLPLAKTIVDALDCKLDDLLDDQQKGA